MVLGITSTRHADLEPMFLQEADVGDVRHPYLVGSIRNPAPVEVRVYPVIMITVGGPYELPFDPAQQIRSRHDPQKPFVVHVQTIPLQLSRHAPVTIAAETQGQPLYAVTQISVFQLFPGLIPRLVVVHAPG